MVREQSRDSNKRGWVEKTLAWIERVGNKLPDPLTLFLLFSLTVILISAIAAALQVSVVHPGTKETIAVVSLLTPDGIQRIVTEARNSHFFNVALLNFFSHWLVDFVSSLALTWLAPRSWCACENLVSL